MLSDTQRATLAATLPAVEGALPEITPRFYRGLFDAHPTLLDNMFNRTHQKSGGEQPQALAGSVAAFARLQLEPDIRRQRFILDRIAHKHASLGVTADQYKVVHQHLFAAIVEVLGDAVTPEVADAWDQLYWDMADLLITSEADLYAAAGVEPGQVWREVRGHRPRPGLAGHDRPHARRRRRRSPEVSSRPVHLGSGFAARRCPADSPVQPDRLARRRPVALQRQARG